MKNTFSLILAIAILSSIFYACKKKENCDPVSTTAPESEVTTLQNYITSYGITAVKDSRGFFYEIISPGGSDKPTVCNDVKVNYVGRLTNGDVFDQGNGVEFALSKLVIGWQEGIPLIGAGGKIKLYLPPSLAYGSQAVSGIPANSILVFDIDLLGF